MSKAKKKKQRSASPTVIMPTPLFLEALAVVIEVRRARDRFANLIRKHFPDEAEKIEEGTVRLIDDGLNEFEINDFRRFDPDPNPVRLRRLRQAAKKDSPE